MGAGLYKYIYILHVSYGSREKSFGMHPRVPIPTDYLYRRPTIPFPIGRGRPNIFVICLHHVPRDRQLTGHYSDCAVNIDNTCNCELLFLILLCLIAFDKG